MHAIPHPHLYGRFAYSVRRRVDWYTLVIKGARYGVVSMAVATHLNYKGRALRPLIYLPPKAAYVHEKVNFTLCVTICMTVSVLHSY